MIRTGKTLWEGNSAEGKGTLSSANVINGLTFSYSSRNMEKGANPEELLAAAQSASFTMALVGLLEQSALMPQQIATEVEIQFEERKGIREIRRIDVCTEAMVPGISFSEFLKHAERALAICPISKALEATEIILHATLKMGIINEIIL